MLSPAAHRCYLWLDCCMKTIIVTTLRAIAHACSLDSQGAVVCLHCCYASSHKCHKLRECCSRSYDLGYQVQLYLAVIFNLESKTDESKSGRSHDLESVICFNKALEQLGKAQVMLKVLLQALLAIGSQHKPHLECSEAPAQRYLPVLHHQRQHLHNLWLAATMCSRIAL